MPKRKKSTRRNTGGRGSVIPLGGPAVPSMAKLEADARVANIAMQIGRDMYRDANWIQY